MTEPTNENDKVVNLKQIKHKRRMQADEKATQNIWQGLGIVWTTYAQDVESRRVEGELCLSGTPSAVFSVLICELVSMGQAMKVENIDILDMLLNLTLDCEPKGRLYELLTKASNLLQYGDEDAWEKMMRERHAKGLISDEEFAREMEVPQ